MFSFHLLLFCCLLPLALSLEDGNYPRTMETPKILQPSGAQCSYNFMVRKFGSGTEPTVYRARALCKDYGSHGPPASVGQPQVYVPIRLSDINTFFNAISKRFSKTPIARSFSFFAEGGDMCQVVKFKAYQATMEGHFAFQKIDVSYMGSGSLDMPLKCPIGQTVNTVTSIVCVRDNCTFPRVPASPDPSPATHAPSGAAVAVADCMAFLGDEVVTARQYDQHRLWVIVAGVACNLVSMAFLAGMIHYCLKYRHLRRQCRSAASIVTASPPAVRHLGSASQAQMMSYTPTGSTYPDYQYSSIARRKLKAQQQRLAYGRHPMDDETLSYRSDHTRLIMPGSNGGLPGHGRHGSMSGSTLQRHGSGAVSPPRGWGHNEDPSTPGSIRRHGSISAVSMTSSGYPRRNGTLPPPPPGLRSPQTPPPSLPPPQMPPPPPPTDQGTVIY